MRALRARDVIGPNDSGTCSIARDGCCHARLEGCIAIGARVVKEKRARVRASVALRRRRARPCQCKVQGPTTCAH
jgi:hypothetical protein